VIKRHPSGLPAWAGRADALISQNKLTEAQSDISASLHLVRHSQILFLQSLLVARQGKYTEANRWLELASSSFSEFPVGYYLYGVLNYRLGQPDTADYYLSRFQAKEPNVSGVVCLRAEIALQRKDPATAITLLKPFVEAHPSDRAAAGLLARAYLAHNQPDDVIQLYQRLLTAPPAQGPAPLDMRYLMMIYGDAVGDLTEIDKILVPSAPEVVPAIQALRNGDTAKAAEIAESLSAAKPDNPWVQDLLGSVRLAQKRLPEAETIFRHVLNKQPNFTPSAFNLVEVLVAENRLDDAREMLSDLAQRQLDDSMM
jgi:predicted Zn-dependent protease